jgi:hypothetical protein
VIYRLFQVGMICLLFLHSTQIPVIFLLFLEGMNRLRFLRLIQVQICLRCPVDLRKMTFLYLPSPNNIPRISVVFTQTLSI